MLRRTLTLSALALAGGLAAVSLPQQAKAFSASNDAVFCQAIGLPDSAQADCRQRLGSATSMDERKQAEADMVSRSALADAAYSGSLFSPAVDANRLNGSPGTPYESRANFVPNQVVAEIRDAMKAAGVHQLWDSSIG